MFLPLSPALILPPHLLQHAWAFILDGVHHLGLWSYVVLAILVAVEGPIVTLIGAGAAGAGALRPEFVFLAAACGNYTSDIMWYSLGSLVSEEWLARRGRWLGLSPDRVHLLQADIREHAPRIILVAKLTLFFAIPALVAAGMAHVPWRRWLPVNALAECIWSGSLVTVGYFLSQWLHTLAEGLQILAAASVLGGLLLFIAILKRYGAKWGETAFATRAIPGADGPRIEGLQEASNTGAVETARS